MFHSLCNSTGSTYVIAPPIEFARCFSLLTSYPMHILYSNSNIPDLDVELPEFAIIEVSPAITVALIGSVTNDPNLYRSGLPAFLSLSLAL